MVGRRCGNIHLIRIDAFCSGTAFGGLTTAGAIHQDAAHRLGGGGKEVLASVPCALFPAGDPEPGFMHERRGLERALVRFAR